MTIDEHGATSVNGTPVRVSLSAPDGKSLSIILENRPYQVVITGQRGEFTALVHGHSCDVVVETERASLLRKFSRQQEMKHIRLEVHAPMPALVVKLLVKEGERVVPGQGLIILEAMKMENEIKAHQPATVREVKVHSGSIVEKGQLLLLLE